MLQQSISRETPSSLTSTDRSMRTLTTCGFFSGDFLARARSDPMKSRWNSIASPYYVSLTLAGQEGKAAVSQITSTFGI